MRGRRFAGVVLAGMICLGGGSFPAMAAEKTRVVVLTQNVKGARLRASVWRHLIEKLPEDIEVTGFKVYQRAAAKRDIVGKTLWTRESVEMVGRSLKLDFAVILKPVVKRGKKKSVQVSVVLIDLAAGKSVSLGVHELSGARLTAKEGARLGDIIVDYVRTPQAEAVEIKEEMEVAPPSEVAEAPVMESRSEPPSELGSEPASELGSESASELVSESSSEPASELVSEPPSGEEVPSVSGLGDASPSLPVGASPEEEPSGGELPHVSVSVVPAEGAPPGSRSSLWFNLGGFQRYAVIEAGEEGTLTCYCGPGEARNPPFPGAGVMFSVFPAASSTGWFRNLGLKGEVSLGELKTQIGEKERSSTVVLGEVAAVLGVPMRLGSRWSEVEAGVGYRYFRFPLAEALFPGVILSGPVAGAAFGYPVATGVETRLLGQVGVPLKASGGTARLGKLGDLGSLYRVEGRVEFELGDLLGGTLACGGWARVDGMTTRFSGKTSLRGDFQGTDVELQDQVLSLGAMVGLTF